MATEFECIVTIDFSFDFGPRPGLFIGAANEGAEAKLLGHIVDPSRRAARLHDDQVGTLAFEKRIEAVACGRRGEELSLSGLRIKKAGSRVEFAEVKCENFH